MVRSTVSFTTCNLYNLNEPGRPIYSGDGWTEEEYRAKTEWLGAALRRMEADVIGLQELWHSRSLEVALDKAGLSASHTTLVPAGHAGGQIVCAAAVRSGMLEGEPEWISDFPDLLRLESRGDDPQTPEIAVRIDRFSRPVLNFAIRPRQDQQAIHVYVCHLKSKAPTRIYFEDWYDRDIHGPYSMAMGAAISTIRRTAEAAALRMILIDRLKNTDDPVVVLGDINDGTLSNTANILTGQPNYLVGLRSGGIDDALYTSQTLQEYRSTRDVYYTHVFNNDRESLDHILVSQEFYDMSRKRIWAFRGLEIMNDHLSDDDHKKTGTTDHGLVRATFEHHPA